jgi:hypothetical protein
MLIISTTKCSDLDSLQSCDKQKIECAGKLETSCFLNIFCLEIY